MLLRRGLVVNKTDFAGRASRAAPFSTSSNSFFQKLMDGARTALGLMPPEMCSPATDFDAKMDALAAEEEALEALDRAHHPEVVAKPPAATPTKAVVGPVRLTHAELAERSQFFAVLQRQQQQGSSKASLVASTLARPPPPAMPPALILTEEARLKRPVPPVPPPTLAPELAPAVQPATVEPAPKAAATPMAKTKVRGLKVAELRAILEARGLDSRGKRAELVGRLQAAEGHAPAKARAVDVQSLMAGERPLESLTRDELRAMLKAQGMRVGGKKAELLGRLSYARDLAGR